MYLPSSPGFNPFMLVVLPGNVICIYDPFDNNLGTKSLSWLDVGLVIRGSLVRFPATPGTLFVLGQNSLFHIASVYPAAKWVPSINKAVLRVCALYAASCSGISPGGLKWFLYVQCLLGEEGRVSTSVDTRL